MATVELFNVQFLPGHVMANFTFALIEPDVLSEPASLTIVSAVAPDHIELTHQLADKLLVELLESALESARSRLPKESAKRA